jgi:peptidoglycan L-alanyl-D-glutamate endopeptidase CwlK
MFNQNSERLLSKLHPGFASLIRKLEDNIGKRGQGEVEIAQGLRTISEQNALYAQGRTRKGPRVTNVPGGYSPHNFGLAVDFMLQDAVVENGVVTKFPDRHKIWDVIGQEAEDLGLEWGGRWKKPVDRPHVEVPVLEYGNGAVLKLQTQGGTKRVWEEADKVLGLVEKKPIKIEFLRHVVEPGDNLTSVAKKLYGDPNKWTLIAQTNNVNAPYVLQPGQVLLAPKE